MSKYVSIEGLEGAGKTTAMTAVKDFFKGQEIVNVREPGGTYLAERARELLKADDPNGDELDSKTEAYFFFGARQHLLHNVVTPALKQGKIVLSDRCYLSSVAYQRNELVDLFVSQLSVVPELIIYMDIEPRIGIERAKGRGELDRIEKKAISFFEEARKVYKSEVEKNDFIIEVDGHNSIEQVYKDVTTVLENYFNKK